MNQNPIEKLIEETRVEIAKISAQLAEKQIELNSYVKAMSEVERTNWRGVKAKKKFTRERSLSPLWKNILNGMIILYSGGATYDQIIEYSKSMKLDIAPDTLRSQMSLYKAKGIVDAVSKGVFIVTEKGQELAK